MPFIRASGSGSNRTVTRSRSAFTSPRSSRVVSSRSRSTGTSSRALADLTKQLEAQRAAQNAEADARFNRINQIASDTVGSANTLFQRAQQQAAGIGQTSAQDIEAARQRQIASAGQGLISAGLGNTTIGASVNRGINADAQRNQIANNESVAGLQAGLLTQQAQAQPGLGGLQIDSLLSRQTTDPNQGLFQQLLAQLASRGV